MKNLILLLFLLILFACNNEDNISLQKCWTMAEREEDVQVFYLCDDERLTLSWFRPTYKFYSNNTCEYLVLSPVDAHYFTDGYYNFDQELSILTVESTDRDLIAKFKILDLKENQLKAEILDGAYYAF